MATFTLDIVFSESAFLNKARTTHSEDSSTSEDESDDSSVRSAHSALKHANLQKAKTGAMPQARGQSCKEPRVDQDQDEDRGSSASRFGPTRENSPAWDIERQGTPSSVEIISPPLPKDKPLVIHVDNCAWSSKLRKPEQPTAISQPPSSKSVAVQSRKEQAPRPTVSSYFSTPQVQAIPPIPSSPLSPTPPQETQQSLSRMHPPRATQPPRSAPRGLPYSPLFNNAPVYPTQNRAYMRTPDVDLPHCAAPDSTAYLLSPEIHPNHPTLSPDIHEGWHFDTSGYHDFVLPIDPDDTQDTLALDSVQHTLLLGDTHDMELDGGAWDGIRYDEGTVEYDPVLDEKEEEFYENVLYGAHPGLEYDEDFAHDGALEPCEHEDELVYEHEGGGQFDEELQGVYGDYGVYAQLEEDLPGDLLDDTDYQGELIHCTDLDVDNDELGLLSSELDFAQDLSLNNNEPINDEDVDSAPRLVRIVTEASLEEDLFKSIGNHWSVAHRIY